MTIMSTTLLAITGAASVLLTGVHVFGGGRTCARPMLDATFDPVAKRTLHVCWHFVTAYLLGTGLALLWVASAGEPAYRSLVQGIAVSYAAFSALFIGAAASSGQKGAWYVFGQWIPFAAMAVGAWLAAG